MNDLRERWIADLHAETHGHLGQSLLQPLGLQAGDVQQRRAGLGVPDAAVLGGGAARASWQNEQIQNEPPRQPWSFDHSRVAKELAEITSQRRRRRSVRRAELDEEDTCGWHE